MAKVELLLQALTTDQHSREVRKLLAIANANAIVLSVSFATETGVQELERSLRRVASVATVFVGIRNEITSIQAVLRLLGTKAKIFAVDTGARRPIFHTKLYLAENATEARAIIGSANMTLDGLNNNIEASALLHLDKSNADDLDFVRRLSGDFTRMVQDHSAHVFRIRTQADARNLYSQGRLTDETLAPAPRTTSRIPPGKQVSIGRMKLNFVRPGRLVRAVRPPRPRHAGQQSPNLVWVSNPLSRRDLNIPQAPKTNPTGSMGWKKGTMTGIDHRTYFRSSVFQELQWVPDRPPSVWERASAQFEIVVANVSRGMFALQLSNNTDRTSRSWKQRNFMTQLHWGNATAIVADPTLLDRTLHLYKRGGNPPSYIVEID